MNFVILTRRKTFVSHQVKGDEEDGPGFVARMGAAVKNFHDHLRNIPPVHPTETTVKTWHGKCGLQTFPHSLRHLIKTKFR
jgi:hypothetical protein